MRRLIRRLYLVPPVAALVFGVAMLTGATIYLVTHHHEQPAARSAAPAQPERELVVAEASGDACDAGECDPYDAYLASNPDPQLVLSREDAQARAYLGCGKTWARGTVDRALADAYRPTGICD